MELMCSGSFLSNAKQHNVALCYLQILDQLSWLTLLRHDDYVHSELFDQVFPQAHASQPCWLAEDPTLLASSSCPSQQVVKMLTSVADVQALCRRTKLFSATACRAWSSA